MKEKQLELLTKVANGELTPEQAQSELLGLFSVTHRNIPTMEDIEKWNCPPAYLKDSKIMYRNWIDEETQFIHEMINDFNIAYYGG